MKLIYIVNINTIIVIAVYNSNLLCTNKSLLKHHLDNNVQSKSGVQATNLG